MKFHNYKIITVLIFANFNINYVHSASIDLTIVGNGQVTITEDSSQCTKSCILDSILTKNTLEAKAGAGASFIGWTGQKCTAGNQALFESNSKEISKAPGGAKTLAKADINGDGIDDLASIGLFDGTITSLVNDGNGEFSKTIIANRLNYPSALDFYDWDNDSDFDLIVAEYGTSTIKIFSNDGLGNFSLSKSISVPNATPYAIAVSDINNDNHPDLLISSFSADITGDLYALVYSISKADLSWFTNDGNDVFSHELNVSDKAAITLSVLNETETGTIHMAAAEIENGEAVVYSMVDNQLQSQVVDKSDGTYGVAFGDIDNDGRSDLLITHYLPSKLNLVYGQDNNTYSEPLTLLRPKEGVTATSIGDFNSDGYADIASGEFNNKNFFTLLSKGYKNCVVYKDENIKLTANFTPVTPISEDKATTESSSGGPANIYLLFALLAINTKRYYQRQTKKD